MQGAQNFPLQRTPEAIEGIAVKVIAIQVLHIVDQMRMPRTGSQGVFLQREGVTGVLCNPGTHPVKDFGFGIGEDPVKVDE